MSLGQKWENWLSKARATEHVFIVLLAILIGVLAGLGAIGIRWSIQAISLFAFPGPGQMVDNIAALPWWWVLLAPALGGLIVGPITHYFAPEAKGTGIPEVMQAVLVQGGKIRKRVALVKAICSSITIGSGGSVGREGPIVQIGASLGSSLAQVLKVPGTRTKTLVGCGAAAGIAAAFNAPIAGALFAAEIILMDFAVAQFSPIVISSVTATVISHHFEGNFAAFSVPHYELHSAKEFFLYALLGVLCGIVSAAFIQTAQGLDWAIEKKIAAPSWLMPALGGLWIGGIGIAFPQIMGVGYGSINHALQGEVLWQLALILVLIKIVGTALTLGFGGSGGIFAPSLFVGAMLGAGFGNLSLNLLPQWELSPGAYALVAMGGIVAGTTRAPITAILTIFELTNQYDVMLPLMLTCILSALISSRLQQESIYSIKLAKKKINLAQGLERNLLKSLFVRDLYPAEVATVEPNSPFPLITEILTHQRSPYLPVLEGKKRLVGMISLHDIKSYLLEKDFLADLIVAQDIAMAQPRWLTPEMTLYTALRIMEEVDLMGLPLVSGAKEQTFIGMIWQKDLLDSYQQEVHHRDITSDLAEHLYGSQSLQKVVAQGVALAEVPIPPSFVGKSLKQLEVRGTYGVMVLSIKSTRDGLTHLQAFPEADYKIQPSDNLLVVAGTPQAVSRLEALG